MENFIIMRMIRSGNMKSSEGTDTGAGDGCQEKRKLLA